MNIDDEGNNKQHFKFVKCNTLYSKLSCVRECGIAVALCERQPPFNLLLSPSVGLPT